MFKQSEKCMKNIHRKILSTYKTVENSKLFSRLFSSYKASWNEILLIVNLKYEYEPLSPKVSALIVEFYKFFFSFKILFILCWTVWIYLRTFSLSKWDADFDPYGREGSKPMDDVYEFIALDITHIM